MNCKDGKCGQCPGCMQKQSMMTLGYSEEAIEAVLEEMEAKYGEKKRPGLWANIHAKRKRIKAGSGERMRKPGSKGAPTREQIKSAKD